MHALMTGRYSVHRDSIAMQYCAVRSPRRGTATSQHMYDRHPITCRHITSHHPTPHLLHSDFLRSDEAEGGPRSADLSYLTQQ